MKILLLIISFSLALFAFFYTIQEKLLPPSMVKLEQLAQGLSEPVFVTQAGDGSGRLFIVEKKGKIRILRNGQVSDIPFLDIPDLISNGSEQGLLGLAFHPQYKENGRFYINYTDIKGDTKIVEYTAGKGNPDKADLQTQRLILDIKQPYANHNGGAIEFGKDGYLYIATGDGGSGGDPHNNGQSLNTLLGKILRIDINTAGQQYLIPDSNPFFSNENARKEIYAYGLRNPWRISFDSETGRLFAGDVGQNKREEVDIIEKGKNYGWRIMEAYQCHDPAGNCSSEGLVKPIADYGREEGVSITGGYVYRGNSLPELRGRYIFGDFGSGGIWSLTEQPDTSWKRQELLKSNVNISSFGLDESLELLVVDYSGGMIFKVVRNDQQ